MHSEITGFSKLCSMWTFVFIFKEFSRRIHFWSGKEVNLFQPDYRFFLIYFTLGGNSVKFAFYFFQN